MKIVGGKKEGGVFVGNTYDKYGSKNLIVKKIMAGFESALLEFVHIASPKSINEIGCGEGYWVLRWLEQGLLARGSDFSSHAINLARENAIAKGLPSSLFEVKSIYDLDSCRDTAELIVCCEVLEHLEDPDAALAALQEIVENYLIVSVPREPIWCAMNLFRGRYIRQLGNTPGHIQHWSRESFIRLVSKYFDVVEIRTPIPWTMLLLQSRTKES